MKFVLVYSQSFGEQGVWELEMHWVKDGIAWSLLFRSHHSCGCLLKLSSTTYHVTHCTYERPFLNQTRSWNLPVIPSFMFGAVA